MKRKMVMSFTKVFSDQMLEDLEKIWASRSLRRVGRKEIPLTKKGGPKSSLSRRDGS